MFKHSRAPAASLWFKLETNRANEHSVRPFCFLMCENLCLQGDPVAANNNDLGMHARKDADPHEKHYFLSTRASLRRACALNWKVPARTSILSYLLLFNLKTNSYNLCLQCDPVAAKTTTWVCARNDAYPREEH